MWKIDNLEVYKRMKKLVKDVYGFIEKLPSEEKFALGDQMRRAVVSVRLNFREGSGKRTSKEFACYLDKSLGSLREVCECFEVGIDLGYFDDEGKGEVSEIKRIERLLVGYRDFVLDRGVK